MDKAIIDKLWEEVNTVVKKYEGLHRQGEYLGQGGINFGLIMFRVDDNPQDNMLKLELSNMMMCSPIVLARAMESVMDKMRAMHDANCPGCSDKIHRA